MDVSFAELGASMRSCFGFARRLQNMRHLFQPRVLKRASIAAAVDDCSPVLSPIVPLFKAAPSRSLWYLEAAIFICCILLWGFVLAWHSPYANRPVFILKLDRATSLATLIGLGTAAAFHVWLDPSLRAKFPEEYPADLRIGWPSVPFVLGFNQLFLVFAPFDWLIRLARNAGWRRL